MKAHRVLIINDSQPGDRELQEITSALKKEFEATGEIFAEIEFLQTDLLSQSINSIVSQINSFERQTPEILLVDANMPNARDGVRLINALRRAGYAGFTYLWSSSSTSSDVETYPAILGAVGSGGFTNTQAVSLAARVRSDWEACERVFRISDPLGRSLVEPLEAALQILSEFLPGCLNSESGNNEAGGWAAASGRALSLFNGRPGSFENVIKSYPNCNYTRLEDAFDLIKLLDRTSPNKHSAIFKALENLRDALLDAVQSYSDAAGFRV
jgi:CheY-like chemotaxis protein